MSLQTSLTGDYPVAAVQYYSIAQAAAIFELSRDHFRVIIKRAGIMPHKRVLPQKSGFNDNLFRHARRIDALSTQQVTQIAEYLNVKHC